MAYNLFQTPHLTKPITVYDPKKSVQENMNGQGQPNAESINTAYNTHQDQTQQPVVQQPSPTIDPTDPASGMNAISQLYTTPEQEEKLRKASVTNQRIMAVADAMRHIGNIYHTVKYAPNQQFNSPVQEEQQRYEKGKAVRDAANLRYYSYQQAKAAQDAKQRQWEADFNAKNNRWATEFKLKIEDAARKGRLQEAQILRQQSLSELDKARIEGVISENEYKRLRNEMYPKVQQSIIGRNNASADAAKARSANGGGRGSSMPDYEVITENTLNDDGRIVSQKKTRTVKKNGETTTSTKTTKKPLPGQSISTTTTKAKKKLP